MGAGAVVCGGTRGLTCGAPGGRLSRQTPPSDRTTHHQRPQQHQHQHQLQQLQQLQQQQQQQQQQHTVLLLAKRWPEMVFFFFFFFFSPTALQVDARAHPVVHYWFFFSFFFYPTKFRTRYRYLVLLRLAKRWPEMVFLVFFFYFLVIEYWVLILARYRCRVFFGVNIELWFHWKENISFEERNKNWVSSNLTDR